jgi:hypothetical protein
MLTNLKEKDWIALGASVSLLYNAVSGFRTGSVILFYGTARRAEDPTLFWTAVAMSAIGGIALPLLVLF